MKKTIISFKKTDIKYESEQHPAIKFLAKKTNWKKLQPKKYTALRGVDFDIKRGEFVSLIGKSGAGKTTIIKAINGVVKLNKGSIEVGGIDVSKLDKQQLLKLRNKISTIFQDYDLIPTQTVLKSVMLYNVPGKELMNRTFSINEKEDIQAAYNMLENLGILEHAHRKILELSGGQKQRVALARALLQDPFIMLADEPVAALDPKMMREVMLELKRSNIVRGITTVVNLHHIEVAIEYSDRIIGLANGKVIFDGTPDELTLEDLRNIYEDELSSFSKDQLKFSQRKNKIWEKYKK